MRKRLIQSIFLSLVFMGILASLFGTVVDVFAQTEPVREGTDFGVSQFEDEVALNGSDDIRVIIARIINVFLGILGILTVCIMLYAGYMWMTSGGDETKIATAKKILINATIGLIIILSSFAITQFVLNRLSDATGFGDRIPGECAGLEFGTEEWERCRSRFNPDLNPCDEGFSGICNADRFYVKSITPSTEETQMANASIKILFSRSMDPTVDVEDVVTIRRDGVEVTGEFNSVAFTENRKGLWFSYNTGLLPPGNYDVAVAEDLLSADDPARELEEPIIDGLRYPRDAQFTIGASYSSTQDTQRPVLSNGFVTQDTAQFLAQSERSAPLIRRDDWAEFTFQGNDNTGISVGRIRLGETTHAGGPVPSVWATFYDGPPTLVGSDAPLGGDGFRYSMPVFFPANVPVPALYRTEVSGWDIDGNMRTQLANTIVVGETCEPITGAPTGPGNVEQCLSLDACEYDWQCVSRRCDQNKNLCVRSPMITQVDPWDGGEGNWITISGIFFGYDEGQVDFGVDDNGDDTIDRWVTAQLPAACEGDDIWNDEWIVVEVPSDVAIPIGTESAIRVTRADADTFEDPADAMDTTVNDRGPGPANQGFTGWFLKNDIRRPGLCSVKATEAPYFGSRQGPPETPVVARGVSFGLNAGTVWFGGNVPAAPTDWNDVNVNTRVPLGLNAGRIGVQVQDGAGERSNGVPFTVLATDRDVFPLIEAIIPPTTTVDAFVTIQGQRFGSFQGQIWAAPTKDAVTRCAAGSTDPSDGCIDLDASSFDQCPNTWSDKEIIAYIPPDMPFGGYAVMVKTQDGLTTNGDDRIEVVDAPPRPSICHLAPRRGPSPLAAGHSGLEIAGLNFSSDPTAYFWYQQANARDLSTWLSADSDDAFFNPISDVALTTLLPVNAGRSMDTGPIYIESTDGLSNPVTYEVFDCRESPGSKPAPDYRCCTEGPEAGVWKQQAFACAGVPRDAGYVWRFTSGQIPNIPYVIEACQQDDWFDPSVLIEQPSPIPWERWRSGDNVCLNANIEVLFSMDMVTDPDPSNSESLFAPGNIELRKCIETFDDGRTCNEVVPLPQDMLYQSRVLSIWDGTDTNLEPNTIYRVVISDQVHGLDQIEVGGVQRTVTNPLKRQRPCEDGAAYCYDFQTGEVGSECILEGAFIHPARGTVNELGEIRTMFRDILYFFVKGKANQECIVLSVDGLGWDWEEKDADLVTSRVAPNGTYTDSRGRGFAWRHTAPETSDIYASASFDVERDGVTVETNVTATSTILVDLGDPRVTDYWPNCLEGCINAGIGARFNRHMDVDTFADGFTLAKCTDETCATRVSPASTSTNPMFALTVDTQLSDQRTLIANLVGNSLFEPNTWYVVTLSDDILSIGGFDPDDQSVILHGDPLQPFEWKFRTKDSDAPCIADRVGIDPFSYIEYVVGNKQAYRSTPFGAPDACSPFGQILNPWTFDWFWDVEDTDVAVVSQFESAGARQPWCTQSCLPSGSDIRCANCFTTDTTFVPIPMCGNGVVEAGEECDLGVTGEIAGVSCTFSCVRPGNAGTECGNGRVEPLLGEQCDPDDSTDRSWYPSLRGGYESGSDGYCSETCTLSGSSQQESGDVNAPICGSGQITNGEQCDTSDPNSREGCTNRCLLRGTQLSQYWCDRNPSSNPSVIAACAGAYSQCGNGQLESGEECEVGMSGATAETCNVACLIIGNVCDTPLAQCGAGEPGCSLFCTLQGASTNHDVPSICGDGIVGQGEYNGAAFGLGRCDMLTNADPLGMPIQTATAVGTSEEIDEITQAMETEISATIRGYASSTEVVSLPGSQQETGTGDYFLQCGFVEFDEPIDDLYNNCVESSHGVGANTCCYPRPQRVAEYPIDGAGLTETDPPYTNGVCRNTYIEATFASSILNTQDGNSNRITSDDLNNSIKIAELVSSEDGECPAGQQKVGDEWNPLDYLAGDFSILGDDLPRSQGFLQRLWNGVKQFFGNIFGQPVFALTEFVFCESNIDFNAQVVSSNGELGISRIAIYIQSLLKENQIYGILLQGGPDGIKDAYGVGIGGQDGEGRTDGWMFITGDEICKLSDVTVRPDTYLYNIPFSTNQFQADAESTNGQLIVPLVGVYNWQWRWAPKNNPLFDIPEEGTPTSTPIASIAARDLEGELSAYAEATVVQDLDTSDNHTGRRFSGESQLYANFCDNIWPARPDGQDGVPFRDNDYHFEFSYCADAGAVGNREDDLPFFDTPVPSTGGIGILSGDTIRRYTLFNDKNDDVITIQIMTNPDRLSLSQWYGERFTNLSQMSRIEVDGYEGLTDGSSNYYVAALTEQSVPARILENHVYLFSISGGAQSDSRRVLEQILDTVRFNTNIREEGYCLPTGVAHLGIDSAPTDLVCQTDFDCRDQDGLVFPETNGICANGRTKLQRDLARMVDIQRMQGTIETYRSNNRIYPDLIAGTYYSGYTNSQWPSWQGTLGTDLGTALGTDPINAWTTCDGAADQQTCWVPQPAGEYLCPAHQSIYEYRFTSPQGGTSDYMLYSQFEYFTRSGSDILQSNGGPPFIDLFIDPDHFTDGRWCAAGTRTSPFGEDCGDGIIQANAGEICELGDTRLQQCGVAPNRGGITQVCNACTSWVDQGQCRLNQFCGNGIVEGTEVCDNGSALNGTYGQCNSSCSGFHAQYCGNGQLDFDDVNGNNVPDPGEILEFCDVNPDGICTYVNEESGIPIRPEVLIVLDRSQTMRACPESAGTTACTPWAQSKWDQAIRALEEIQLDFGNTVDFYVQEVPGLTSDQCSLYHPSLSDYLALGPSVSRTSNRVLTGFYLTPTTNAFMQVNANINGYFPRDSESKYIFLITDGEVYHDTTGGPCSAGKELMEAELARLRGQGIPTYVLSYENTNPDWSVWLDLFAQAAGTVDRQNIDADYYQISGVDSLTDTFSDILGCQPYSVTERGACAIDCQGPGAYCGDGRVDRVYGEECDDGNSNAFDNCSNICELPDAIQTVAPDPIPPSCGNFIVEGDEECDAGRAIDGGENGVAPDPTAIPYGENRTWCSERCEVVTTVDSAYYCGNGIRDWAEINGTPGRQDDEWLEACDAGGDGVTLDEFGNLYASCDQWKSNVCSQGCQVFDETGCFQCGAVNVGSTRSDVQEATVSIELVHALTVRGSWQPAAYRTWLSSPVNQYVMSISDTAGGSQSVYEFESATADISDYYTWGQDWWNMQIFDRGGDPYYNRRLVTDAQCTNDYVISFNDRQLGLTPGVASPLRDVFPLPVNGQSALHVPLVYSTALPQEGIRVIFHYPPNPGTPMGQPIIGHSIDASPGAYVSELGEFLFRGSGLANSGDSGASIMFDPGRNAWVISTVDNYSNPSGVKGSEGWFSDPSISPTRFLWPLDIYLADTVTTEPIAIYVTIAGAWGQQTNRTILEMMASGVEAWVYLPRDGQNGMYSTYAPDLIIPMSQAAVRPGVNPGARIAAGDDVVWHLFNLVHNGNEFEIQQPLNGTASGVIVPDACSVRDGIPGDSCP